MKFEVMNAKIGTMDLLENKNLIFEPKLDGIRALCYANKTVKFISRNNIDITKRFPALENVRKNIKAKTCILDGEIVAFDKKGNPSFTMLQKGHEAKFIAFDVLMNEGKDLTSLPLLERKKILEKIVSNGKSIEKIVYTSDGKKLWNIAVKKGLEGVMAKEPHDKYYVGKRSGTWLKIKSFRSLDCIIIGYTTKKRGLSSLALALFDNKELKYIGKVGTGFNEENTKELFKKLTPLKTDEAPIKNLKLKDITWLKPKLVCEVKYLEFTSDKILRTSVFMRLRFDKKAKDCNFKDQI